MVVAKSRNVGAELREYPTASGPKWCPRVRVLEVLCASVSRLAHLQEVGKCPL